MTTALAIALSAVVFAIAALHAYWGLGGIWPATSEERLAKTVIGRPNVKRMPGPLACFLVAASLAVVAAWPLFLGGLLAEPWPRRFTLLADPLIAGGFFGRAIATFKPGWRNYFPEQPFAKLDRGVYAPLCLLLGTGYMALLFGIDP
jgi:uncharacterized protein DUF3995